MRDNKRIRDEQQDRQEQHRKCMRMASGFLACIGHYQLTSGVRDRVKEKKKEVQELDRSRCEKMKKRKQFSKQSIRRQEQR
jgi:hypothetical protein